MYKRNFDKYILLENLLFFVVDEYVEISILPTWWIAEIASVTHEIYNHLGSKRLFLSMKKEYWHPQLKDLITEITKTCPLCQIMKPYTNIKTPPLHRTVARRPFDLVCLDVLSLPKTKRGNSSLLLISDHCSKFLVAYPIKNHTTETIIHYLEQYLMSSPTCIKSLLTDSAPELASDKFKEYCEKRDIIHLFSSPYVSHCNSYIERNCGQVVQHLKFVLGSIENWDQEIYQIVVAHNHSPSLTTMQSPSDFLLLNSHLKQPESILPPKIADKWRLGSPHFKPYAIGSEVLLRKHYLGNIASNKLKIKFGGIYVRTSSA